MAKEFPIAFDFEGRHYEGMVVPSTEKNEKGLPITFKILLDNIYFGNISYKKSRWVSDSGKPQHLVDIMGKYIQEWYE